jgi:hypothetical protein
MADTKADRLQEECDGNQRLSARWKEIQEIRERRKAEREKRRQEEEREENQPTPMDVDERTPPLPPLVRL